MDKAVWIIMLFALVACNPSEQEEENTFSVVGTWENTLDFQLADTSVDMIKSLMEIQDSTNSFLEFMPDSTGEARLFEGTPEQQTTPFRWKQVGDTIRTSIQDRSFDYLILSNDSLEVIALQQDPFGVRGKLVRQKTN